MKKLAASVIVLAVLAAGAWFGLKEIADHRLQAGIRHYRATLPAGDSLTYASAQTMPLQWGARFTGLEIHRRGIVIRADDARFSHVSETRLGGVELAGVTFQANGIKGSIAGVEASDLSADPGANPPRLDQARIGSLHFHATDLHAPAIPGFSVRIGEFQFSQHPGQPGTLLQHGIADQLQVLSQSGLAMLIAHLADESHGVLQGGTLSDVTVTSTMTGLQIAPDSALGLQLGKLGYPSAQGDGSSHFQYTVTPAGTPGSVTQATGVVDPVVLRLAGIGQVSIAMTLDHLPLPSQTAATDTTPAATAGQARLLSMTFAYTDAGLIARLLQHFAESGQTTPEQLRDRLRHLLKARGDADGNSGFEPEIIRFVDDPRQFVIALNPPSPLLLNDLATIQRRGPAAMSMLGLTVKAD